VNYQRKTITITNVAAMKSDMVKDVGFGSFGDRLGVGDGEGVTLGVGEAEGVGS